MYYRLSGAVLLLRHGYCGTSKGMDRIVKINLAQRW